MSKNSRTAAARGLDLDAILREGENIERPNKPKRYAPDVAKARRSEQVRRAKLAQYQAFKALSILHPDEYRVLWEQAKTRIAAEGDGLPGD